MPACGSPRTRPCVSTEAGTIAGSPAGARERDAVEPRVDGNAVSVERRPARGASDVAAPTVLTAWTGGGAGDPGASSGGGRDVRVRGGGGAGASEGAIEEATGGTEKAVGSPDIRPMSRAMRRSSATP